MNTVKLLITAMLLGIFCVAEAYAAQDYNGTRSNRSAGIVAAEENASGDLSKLTASAKKAISFIVNQEADGDPNAEIEVYVNVSVTACKVDKEGDNKGKGCSGHGVCQFGRC